LTDAELVAILIRVGFQGTNAVELGRQLLQRFGSLRAMAEAPVTALLDVKGLKGAKAAQLLAAMEIARRVALPDRRERVQIKGTTEAAEYLLGRLRGLAEEHFRGLYLNRRNRLLDDYLAALGTVDSVRPPLRNIVARALQVNASAIIAGHNHPSGAAKPGDLVVDAFAGSGTAAAVAADRLHSVVNRHLIRWLLECRELALVSFLPIRDPKAK
jgi:DNA repair protein RadC